MTGALIQHLANSTSLFQIWLTKHRPWIDTLCVSNKSVVQFEGDFGEILALGAELSPYIGLSRGWESPYFFLSFILSYTIDKLSMSA